MKSRHDRRVNTLVISFLFLFAIITTVSVTLAQEAVTPEDKIANAMSAAPTIISQEAAVWDWPTEGTDFTELRAGSNGWTCVPANAGNPANDPMCLDAQWVEWLTARMEGREPNITAFGWAYMLQGGAAASDADPSAPAPANEGDWLIDAPHVMLIGPDAFDTDTFLLDRGPGSPYLMWAGTPWEHIMIPTTNPGDY